MCMLSLQEFVDNYLLMVRACAERDSGTVVKQSVALGFLTGLQLVVSVSVCRCCHPYCWYSHLRRALKTSA